VPISYGMSADPPPAIGPGGGEPPPEEEPRPSPVAIVAIESLRAALAEQAASLAAAQSALDALLAGLLARLPDGSRVGDPR